MAELLHAIFGWFAVRWGRTLLLCTVCGAGFKGGFLKHYRYTDTQDIRGFSNLLPDMLASWLQNCQGPRTTAWILSEDAEAIKNMWFWYIYFIIFWSTSLMNLRWDLLVQTLALSNISNYINRTVFFRHTRIISRTSWKPWGWWMEP